MRTATLASIAAALTIASSAACGTAAPGVPPVASAEHHHDMHLPPVGPSVDVRLDAQSHPVDLAQLPHATGSLVALADIVRAAYPNRDASRWHVDLLGSDGFRPMSRPKCTHLLARDEVAHLRLDVTTHDVSVDDGLTLPGCYRVRAVVAIDLTAITSAALGAPRSPRSMARRTWP